MKIDNDEKKLATGNFIPIVNKIKKRYIDGNQLFLTFPINIISVNSCQFIE